MSRQPKQPNAGKKLPVLHQRCHFPGQFPNVVPDIATPAGGICVFDQAAGIFLVFGWNDKPGMGKKPRISGVVQMQVG